MAILGALNLVRSWNTAWTAISGPLGRVSTWLAVVGALLVVVAIVEYARGRHSTSGGKHAKLLYTIVVGAVLAAPGFVVPALLTSVDFVVNTLLGLLGHKSGG